MNLILLLILLLSSCEFNPNKISPLLPGEYFVSGCTIFDENSKIIKNFGLGHCLFFPNGNTFHAQEKNIKMRAGDGKIIWEKNIPTHHSPALSHDGQSIIILSTEDIAFRGKLTRFDLIYKLDLKGRILAAWHLKDHFAELEKKIGPISSIPSNWFPESKATVEYSHLNSVQSLAVSSSFHAAFQKGNLLVNLHLPTNAFLILDENLKDILWISNYRVNAHDVQFVGEDKILLFHNRNTELEKDFSSIEIVSLKENRPVWAYGLNPEQNFFAKIGGTVQGLTENRFLLTILDVNMAVRIVSLEGKKVWEMNPKLSFLSPMLDIRIQKLDSYLKRSL